MTIPDPSSAAAQAAALQPASYHDIAGLQGLKGRARQDGQSESALRAATQQFEALLIQEMMRTMRQATIKSDLIESNALDTFEAMFDKEVSLQMAKRGGMGLSEMLVQQMSKNLPQTQGTASSSQDVLQARQAAGLPLQRKPQGMELAAPDARPPLPLPIPKPLPLKGRGLSE